MDATWAERQVLVQDEAVVDRRGLYLLFGRDPEYARQVSEQVRAKLTGDTTSYERQGPRPEEQRLWSVLEVNPDSSNRMKLVARLSYGARQHTETFMLVRGHYRGVPGWMVVGMQISELTFY